MLQNFLKNFPPEFEKTITDLYDTILKRSLMRAYENLEDEKKAMMAKIFNSENDTEKKDFLDNYLGDLNDIMLEETEKLLLEIKK
jgi:hypothetical protein